MWKKSKDNICISITDQEVKAVLIKGNASNARVINAAIKDVADVKPDELPKVLASALKPVKAKGANVCLIAPPTTITTKNIEIPSTNQEEIQSIVSLQAGRHTPFARDEIQIGYVNIGVHKNNYSKVLLVIVNKSALKEQISVLSRAGLKVSKVFFAPESVAEYYANALGLKGKEETVGIIDVGKLATEFVLISNGVVATSRNIPVGKDSLSAEGDAAKERLIEEISKTVEASQTEEIIDAPSKYVLANDDPVLRDLQAGIEDKLKVTTEIVPYIDKVNVPKGVLKKIATDYAAHSFLEVIAPAAYAEGRAIDLLPEEIQIQEMIASQGKEIFRIAILSFFLLVVVGSLFSAKMYYSSQVLEKYTEKYAENKEKVAFLEDVSLRTKIVKRFLDDRMTSLEIIDHLYQEIPKEIYLTNIMIDGNNRIRLEGISDIGSLIHELVTQLGQSEYFAKVDLMATSSRKDRGKDVHAFEIVIQLTAPEEEDSNSNTTETEE